jgi:copper chaperone
MNTTVTVEGMSCKHCEQTIEDALQSVGDISYARANHETETVVVEDDSDISTLVRTVEDAGYTVHA